MELGGKLRRVDATKRLLDGREPWRAHCCYRVATVGFGCLQLLDERVGLVAREPTARLALREPHRAARVAEIGVPGLLQEAEQLLHLARRRGWAGLLSECHERSLAHTYDSQVSLCGARHPMRLANRADTFASCRVSAVAADLPLPTLLSQALIAFTIELDNEFERQFTDSGLRAFGVSLVMWSNLMRFVDDEGVTVGEIPALAGVAGTPATSGWIQTSLAGMERWGYIIVAPDPADGRAKPPRREWHVRPTLAGKTAREIWGPLVGRVEARWKARFGAHEIGSLRESLRVLVDGFGAELPRYLPVMIYGDGLRAPVAYLDARQPGAPAGGHEAADDLSVLLSRALLAFTIEFERESDLSLSVSANVLRVLDDHGVNVRDLAELSGVSKEGISATLTFLEKRGVVVSEPSPAGRGKAVRLTPQGRESHDAYRRLLAAVEERWRERFGAAAIDAVRSALHALFDRPEGGEPRLSEGLVPPAAGWRAKKPYLARTEAFVRDPAAALPHYPMVLHRGGWPDGS